MSKPRLIAALLSNSAIAAFTLFVFYFVGGNIEGRHIFILLGISLAVATLIAVIFHYYFVRNDN